MVLPLEEDYVRLGLAAGEAGSAPLTGPLVVCGSSSRHGEAEPSIVDRAHNHTRVVCRQAVEDGESLGGGSGENRHG